MEVSLRLTGLSMFHRSVNSLPISMLNKVETVTIEHQESTMVFIMLSSEMEHF